MLYAFILLVKYLPAKKILSLIKWRWYLNPYLLYVFLVVLFIIVGKRIRMMILLNCMI